MKFLIDECVGRSVFNWFRDNGFDVLFVKDEFEGADDDWVLDKAVHEGRIVITSDKDFGDMVFRDKKNHVGIVLLRLVDESSENKIRIIDWLLKNHRESLVDNFVLAGDSSVRIVQKGLFRM